MKRFSFPCVFASLPRLIHTLIQHTHIMKTDTHSSPVVSLVTNHWPLLSFFRFQTLQVISLFMLPPTHHCLSTTKWRTEWGGENLIRSHLIISLGSSRTLTLLRETYCCENSLSGARVVRRTKGEKQMYIRPIGFSPEKRDAVFPISTNGMIIIQWE